MNPPLFDDPVFVTESILKAVCRTNFDGFSKEILEFLCRQTGSNHGGVYLVKVLKNGKVILLSWSVGGKDADEQNDFTHWLGRVEGLRLDMRVDHMVSGLLPRLGGPAPLSFNIRGTILPDHYFSNQNPVYEQRVKEGISHVSDIMAGFYPIGLTNCFLAFCVYRLGSRQRYGNKELGKLDFTVRKHSELYKEGFVPWSIRWPTVGLAPREWEMWQLLAAGLTNEKAAAKMCISQHTADEYVKKLHWKLNVKRRAELVSKFYDLPILDVA
jgi:DNA-binding CsgD family transcriptional regulator